MDNLIVMPVSHLLNILLAMLVIVLVGFVMLLARIAFGRGSQPVVVANSQGETDGGSGWLMLVAVIIIAVILLQACGNMQ